MTQIEAQTLIDLLKPIVKRGTKVSIVDGGIGSFGVELRNRESIITLMRWDTYYVIPTQAKSK